MPLPDLLAELRRTFPQGATTGTFEVAGIQSGAYTALFARLGLPAVLPLTSALGWTTDGDGDGAAAVLTGTATGELLGVRGGRVAFRFTPAGPGFTLLLDLTLPAGWVFGTSFALLGGRVFDDLAVFDPAAHPDRASALIVASGPAADPLRTVDGAAAQVSAGLSFFGQFDPASTALGAIAEILDGGATQTVFGPVGYAAATGAVQLDLVLAKTSVSGLFGASGPRLDIDLALSCALDPAGASYLIGLRFDTELEFGTVADPGRTIELSALLSDSNQGVLELALSGSAFDFPAPQTLSRYFGPDNGFAGSLPDQFGGGNLVQIDGVTFGLGLGRASLAYAFLTVGALTGHPWVLWPDVLEVGDLDFQFAVFEPLNPDRSLAFTFGGTIGLGPVDLRIGAQLPSEVITGQLADGDARPAVLPLLAHVFGFTPPLGDALYIETLDFSADLTQGVYQADLVLDGEVSFDFGDDNVLEFEQLAIGFAYTRQGATGQLSGLFTVSEQEFAVGLELAKGGTVFTGSWSDPAAPLNYQDVAIALGLYGLPNLPDGIDLGLTAAEFEFDSAGPSFAADLTTTYGDAALVAGKGAAGGWGFVFGMILGLDLTVDLTSIPLIGRLVPQGDDVISLTDLRVVGANSTPITYQHTDQLDRILGAVVDSGLSLSIGLQLGKDAPHVFTVHFGGPDDGTGDDIPPEDAFADTLPDALTAVSAGGPTPGPQITWLPVQRAFGPMSIQRLGFALATDDALALYVDGGVTLAGLSVELTGLEAVIPLHSPYLPAFSLAGLGVSYQGAGLTVAGGLGKAPGVTPAEYSGDLTIVFGEYGASAVGSYTTTADGRPSLFAFLFVDAPLGGPAFFFVTGLAGGFGYNRALRLPTIDQVASFPLVQGATGQTNQAQTQQALTADITVEENEDWLAAGVRFTSFGMIDSFVLATVSFGTSVRIALLGESTLTVPALPDGGQAAPIAVADLVLEIDVEPAAGVVSAQARLTPRSYLLSPAAHLTGGFAFFLWFGGTSTGGDGPSPGDFVVSLGGYSPYYTKPAYYPDVPRLGLNWQVSSELVVEGGLYFALTPAVLMAGGSLKAAWNGGGLTAWFNASADFLVRFQPFRYAADAAVSIGASYTVDLLLTTKTITVQVGADLHLWGPPFGGTARVDLWIVSFTISFGDQPPAPANDLTWSQFRSAFLPPVQSGKGGAAAPPALPIPAPLSTPTDSLLVLNAPGGLLGTTGSTAGNDADWLVDPTALRLGLATQIPSKTAAVTSGVSVPVDGAWGTGFGIGPMGLAPAAVETALTVTIDRDGPADLWTAAAVTGSVPAAIWLNTGAALDAPRLVADVLTGLSLTPAPPAPDWSEPVPADRLTVGPAPERPFAYSTATVPHTDPFDQSTAWQTVAATLGGADPTVAATRSGILAALRARGLTTAATVDTAATAAQAAQLYAAAPTLRLLGEQPAPRRADRGAPTA